MLQQLITHDSKVSDIIVNQPSTITVLNRFGITMGVGDKTIDRICDEHNINPDFLATILNTFINNEYFPDDILEGFNVREIVSYLNKTNAYYEHYQLPNIERHFQLLISKSVPHNNNLGIMMQFFREVKQQLLDRIDFDRNRWFPQLLEQSTKSVQDNASTHGSGNLDLTDNIEDKIDDLISMMVIHLQGDYDTNLCTAVLFTIVSLKNDIMQNNRIRNRIARPIHEALYRK